ncbi:DUF423 domain-containing protein [Alsobacter sp. KACC 23698]|uniref:DUF423 domain-containing protein n=1 Tax=Alsobacter sp. KACC 23698 TaxID=3149229 RepID=A0AAU7JGH1_9HYPH
MNAPSRVFMAAAGVAGAAGVALGAASAHVGGANLGTAANFLLFHAPALLGVGLLAERSIAPSCWVVAAGALLGLGVALFSGALALGALAGWRPIPMAAPAGGLAMIAGWLTLAAAGLFGRR